MPLWRLAHLESVGQVYSLEILGAGAEAEVFLFFFSFWWRGEEREKHGSIAFCTCSALGTTSNPGMCLNWESNRRTFTLQDVAQPTKPHQ